MRFFRAYSLTPIAVLLVGCSFFSLDEPEPTSRASGGTGGATAGTGGASGGTGGATGGTGGAVGGSAGTPIVAGTGGNAGNSGAGGGAGAGAGGAGASGGGGAGGAGAGGSAGGGAGSSGAAGAGGGSGGSAPNSCASINAQAMAFGGHCYYRNTTPVTWSSAKMACEALSDGGHLVTITSMEEQEFVWDLAGMMDAWIGATDGMMDSQMGNGTPFTWITAEDIGQFNGWASEEPNNYQKDCPGGGTCWEHCGFMWVDTQGAWNDDICGYDKAYICEWDSGG